MARKPSSRKKFSSEFNVEDLSKKLEEFVEGALKKAARPGAFAMAKLVYQTAWRDLNSRVDVDRKPQYFYGRNKKYGPFPPGHLRDSLYIAYSKDRSTETRAEYHVSWNYGAKDPLASKAAPYGFMVEFGNSRSGAHPFLYPAYKVNKDQLPKVAFDAMRESLGGGLV